MALWTLATGEIRTCTRLEIGWHRRPNSSGGEDVLLVVIQPFVDSRRKRFPNPAALRTRLQTPAKKVNRKKDICYKITIASPSLPASSLLAVPILGAACESCMDAHDALRFDWGRARVTERPKSLVEAGREMMGTW